MKPGTGPVVVLAGGTGGSKLARGMLDVAGEELVVIANPGDDIEIYGAYVSPDLDLATFWLADRIDPRGWGLDGDTFAVMDGLRELGIDVWFNLGDRDLALGLERARRLQAGETPTAAHRALTRALGVEAQVIPPTDGPLRTWVRAADRPWPFQEFMIRHGAAGPVQDVEYRGAAASAPTPEALAAIRDSPAPVVAVSPLVDGDVVKGPTAEFLAYAGAAQDSDGIAGLYGGLIDGLVADAPTGVVPCLHTDVRLDTAEARRAVAERTLEFALGLTQA